MKGARLSIFCVLPCLLSTVSSIYLPLRQYEGPTFFDQWAYYGNVDNTTWGNVTYLDQPNASEKRLTYTNEAGNAIVKVDNTTTLLPGPIVNRDSIRLTSLDSYGVGSLIIIDALHIPYGCSVWPAFWTFGIQQEWPSAGEIDIIEAINNMDHNQIALHTTPGCFQAPTPPQTGRTLANDCSTNRGCIVAETKTNSFGPGFAQAGGGAFAIQIEADGIYSWFWSRPDIPENVRTATPDSEIDVLAWGLPTAAYPVAGCDIERYFPPQNLVLLTTLCGVWAGQSNNYRATCQTPTNSCVADNVIGPGSTYDTAYWEVRYVRAYISEDAPPPPPSSSATTTTDTAASSDTPSPNVPIASPPTLPSSAGSLPAITIFSCLILPFTAVFFL